MKRISKYSVIIFLFCITNIYANKVQDVFVSSPAYTIDTQFRALFVKPNSNNIYYVAQAFPFNNNIATPVDSPSWQTTDLHPKYHCGFDLGLRAIIHSRNSAFALNWQHFASSTSASQVAGTNDMVGPFSSIGPDAAPYTHARGQVQFAFNEFNVRYGQYMNIGSYLETNLFAGISFARIKQKLFTLYSNGTANTSRTTIVPSSFTGAGPLCGFEGVYNIVRGFNCTGALTVALLMGKTKNHTTFLSTSPELVVLGDPFINKQSITSEKRTQMTPSFGQRLGVAYCHGFREERSMIEIELGWENKILLNAIQSNDMGSGVIDVTPAVNTTGVFARTFHRILGNFSFGGPYLGFDVMF